MECTYLCFKLLRSSVSSHTRQLCESDATMVELGRDAEGILRRVAKGERFLLTHRGRPAARLEPVGTNGPVGSAADPFLTIGQRTVDETATLLLMPHSHAAAANSLKTTLESRTLRLEWIDSDRFHGAGMASSTASSPAPFGARLRSGDEAVPAPWWRWQNALSAYGAARMELTSSKSGVQIRGSLMKTLHELWMKGCP